MCFLREGIVGTGGDDAWLRVYFKIRCAFVNT